MTISNQAPSADNYRLGKGELFFDRYDATGARTGYFHLGNCNKVIIKLVDDIKTLRSSMHADGGILKRAAAHRDVEIEIVSNEFAIENMALALMGDQSTFTQAASSATAEILSTALVAGRYYKLAHRAVSSVVLTVGTSTTPLTVGTHYDVSDPVGGIVHIKQSYTGTGGLTAAYSYATATLDLISGATKTKVEGGLIFVPDPTTGPQTDLEVWRCAVNPGGDFGFIGDDFGEYTLSMVALNDAAGVYGGSASQPYFRMIERGVA